MGRTRNWSQDTLAEVFIRHFDFQHSTTRIASATGLSYQQVYYFLKEFTDTTAPVGLPGKEAIAAVRERLEPVIAAEDTVWHEQQLTAAQERGQLTPERRVALDEEVIGCIDLVKQAASQFGITPRKFLWLCSTHAQCGVVFVTSGRLATTSTTKRP